METVENKIPDHLGLVAAMCEQLEIAEQFAQDFELRQVRAPTPEPECDILARRRLGSLEKTISAVDRYAHLQQTRIGKGSYSAVRRYS